MNIYLYNLDFFELVKLSHPWLASSRIAADRLRSVVSVRQRKYCNNSRIPSSGIDVLTGLSAKCTSLAHDWVHHWELSKKYARNVRHLHPRQHIFLSKKNAGHSLTWFRICNQKCLRNTERSVQFFSFKFIFKLPCNNMTIKDQRVLSQTWKIFKGGQKKKFGAIK